LVNWGYILKLPLRITRESEKLKEFFLKEVNWDYIVNESADFNEIDKETVRRFIRMAKNKGRLTMFDEDTDIKTLFEHLKLSIDGKLTNGAGKNPQKYFLNAVLRVARLKNEITIIGDRLIEGNLFQQVFEGEEAIKNFINVRYEIKELVRREIWDYPLEAIREALRRGWFWYRKNNGKYKARRITRAGI